MSQDTLSDVLRAVRLRSAIFYYVSLGDEWVGEAPAAREIADAVLPGAEHVIEYHMMAKGDGWAATDGAPGQRRHRDVPAWRCPHHLERTGHARATRR